jgi:hypothetical protein
LDFSRRNGCRPGLAGPARCTRGWPDWPFIRHQTALRLRHSKALSSADVKPASVPKSDDGKQNPLPAITNPVLIAPQQRVQAAASAKSCRPRYRLPSIQSAKPC